MSDIEYLLHARRSVVYSGETLELAKDHFRNLLKNGAQVHDNFGVVIALENVIRPGAYRAWILFDAVSRNTARSIEKMLNDFVGDCVIAETDNRGMRNILTRLGFRVIDVVGKDYHLLYSRS